VKAVASSAIADLDRHRCLCLATFRRDGTDVRTPVWFAAADGRLYVFTAGEAGKVKRLRQSPRARAAASDMRGAVRGPWRDATARLVSDPSSIERARAALCAKYGGQMWLADLLSRLTGRYQRRAWIEIEI
jgi:PPOX class probable F420-dependent enzyme